MRKKYYPQFKKIHRKFNQLQKKGPGRPAGAKNKPKPPPKPKPKAKAKKEPEYEDYSEEDETPPPRRSMERRGGVQQQPQELDRHALASEVLNILQQQRYNQTSARRSHYASWFANM